MKELLGDRPLVLDREFSYEELFTYMASEGIKVIIKVIAEVIDNVYLLFTAIIRGIVRTYV